MGGARKNIMKVLLLLIAGTCVCQIWAAMPPRTPKSDKRGWARRNYNQEGDMLGYLSGRVVGLPNDQDYTRVANRTLGFEKIIALGLPERTDKRDALTLMAALSDIDIEWIAGVKPEDIPAKAVPYGIDVSKIEDNFLGSWRAHLNAIRQ